MNEKWRVWDQDKDYGNLFFKRAIGELPEMESSKAIAKIIKQYVDENDQLLDVGCGSGHYLRSIDKVLDIPFKYHGIDPTEYYIKKGTEAFAQDINKNNRRISTKFTVGDIYNLPIEDNSADIVMCNNVLLHLPSIETPIKELIRVSKKYVIIRMLLGKSSFRIKQIEKPEEYDKNGEPINFHYYNIYSEDYLKSIFSNYPDIKFSILDDMDYNFKSFGDQLNYVNTKPDDLTSIINGIQLNVYVLQPWKFVIIEKK